MGKFYGSVGFFVTHESETSPGVWIQEFKEREYYGDIYRQSSNFDNNSKINDDISLSMQVSILADPYAQNNYKYARYVSFGGTKWSIKNIDVEYPRLKFTLGGMFNGDEE